MIFLLSLFYLSCLLKIYPFGRDWSLHSKPGESDPQITPNDTEDQVAEPSIRPLEFEKGQATLDETQEVNLGTNKEPRPMFIN